MWQKFQKLGELFSNLIGKSDQESSDYVNLAPTDKADPSGIYCKALLRATNDKDVFNIALTGPYGSGKSSIIKTFLKEYGKVRSVKRPVLQISLAAFLPEAILTESSGRQEIERSHQWQAGATESRVSKQEIERSILQQMLYGADANDLPLSRFKRIQAPKFWSPLISLLIMVGIFSFWHVIQQRTAIFDGSFFQPFDYTNWFNLGCFAIGFVFVWLVLHQIYVKSFGVSLKSISLKDIEITPETANEESILNRHLDEIIYFFQSTKYDLVVVEDLDRFNNPDIFVTLREINSLINANAGVKRQIRFLYALRDNMFATTDRTKFFEFIVPVIPIINSSNSIDKVLEQGERLSLEERLDGQFLREVSRYLDDLRLIRNIFNEYAIYIKNLESDDESVLNPSKLLAVLIYKNVLPSDFEALHRGKGKLADILSKHDALIANAESRYKSEISDLERQIADADKQVPADLNELRMIYAAALISKIPQGYIFIEHNGHRNILIQSLSGFEDFDQIVEAQTIFCRSAQNQRTQVNLAGFQTEVSQIKSYSERKAEIEAKSQLFKDKTSKTVRELRGKIATLRTKKFNEIIRTDAKGNESLFDAFGESRELIRFLILEGFLDDTYYQYTSLFHSGRLSPNDNKFLIQIRAHNSTEPNFQIDNPKEVIAAMREDDFIQSFVLNVILVDCLLNEPTEYSQKIDSLVRYISSNFQNCRDFFSTYYERGKFLPQFTSLLVQNWQGFISAALASSECVTHVARLIAHLPEDQLKSLHDFDDDVSEFISEHLSEILALDIDFAPERLALLAFEVQDLTSMEPYPAVASLLTNEGMYTVSIANLDFACCSVLGLPVEGSLNSKHYSTVLRSGNSALIDKVESEFYQYLTDVLLALDGNIDEDVSTIVRVLNHDEIEAEPLELFLEKQATKLPSLDNIPLRLHAPAFRLKKVETTWKNCLAFLNGEAFDAATLTDYLSDQHIQDELSVAAIDGGDEARPLRQFLLNNNDLQAETYRAYVQALPKKFNAFPDGVDAEKLLILIDEDKITFSESTFSALGDHPEYQAKFIAKNIEKFLPMRDKFSIDDDFRERLLGADITNSQRLEIVRDMDLTSLGSLPSRASTIGALYHRTDADVSPLPGEAAQAMIIHTNPISAQIGLLNKCRNLLTDEQIQQVLQKLPSPFPDFRPSYGRPTIPKTEVNIELVDWLVGRKIISSWKETFFGDEIRVYNFRP